MIGEEAVGLPRKTFVPGLAEVSGNDLGTSADYRYLTTDHLGSTRGMWDASLAQTGSWEFTPYGSPFHFAGPSDVTQLFTGHDLDKVTGQYYAAFRFLNPATGRWLSSDPLGMVDGTNTSSYVQNNPVMAFDVLGLMMPSPEVLVEEAKEMERCRNRTRTRLAALKEKNKGNANCQIPDDLKVFYGGMPFSQRSYSPGPKSINISWRDCSHKKDEAFDETLLHEIGHAVDTSFTLMNRIKYIRSYWCQGGNVYGENAPESYAKSIEDRADAWMTNCNK